MTTGATQADGPISDDGAVRLEVTREALRQSLAACMSGPQVPARGAVEDLGRKLRSVAGMGPGQHRQARLDAAGPLDAAGAPVGATRIDPARHALPAEVNASLFETFIEPALFGGLRASGAPQAVVIGAHLGCGISQAAGAAARELGRDAAAILMADDLRAFHPDYARLVRRSPRLAAFYTEADAQLWLQRALHSAVRRRLPFVLEATPLRSAELISKTFEFIREGGYRVQARTLAVPHAVSWQAILCVQEQCRLEFGVSRHITSGAHQATYDGLPSMLEWIEREQMAHSVSVHDRHGSPCLGPGTPLPACAANVLRVLRELPPTLAQRRRFAQTYLWLETLLNGPGRGAANDELLEMEGLRWDAHCALLAQAFLEVPRPECLREFPQLRNAFDVLENVRAASEALPDRAHAALLAKRAAEGIARRIGNGNITAPAPWLPSG
jgi:hypothetical protein